MEDVAAKNPINPPHPNCSHRQALPDSTTPTAKMILEILFRKSPNQIEPALATTGIVPTPDVVIQVLNLSYDYPFCAVKFFRWAGLAHKHNPKAWNLMVDLLGRNRLFDSMWDAIRSMRHEGVLSLNTFAIAFANYCASRRFDEALMTFQVMDKYGISQDVVAANSLLSAMCRENGVASAVEFLEVMKSSKNFGPDGDSFVILLEGFEKEGSLGKVEAVFEEMVACVGWNQRNMSAYEEFLMRLVKSQKAEVAVGKLREMKTNGCFPGLGFFSNVVGVLVKLKSWKRGLQVWDVMVGSGLVPNLEMYNALIGLMCDCNEVDEAFKLLDVMVFDGAFPDSFTYNVIFKCLIKNNKVRQAGKFFVEMVKNECLPTHFNFAAAITMFFDGDDPEMGVEIWNFMVENRVQPLDAAANALLLGLCKLDRLSELKRNADDMLDRRISIYESTMASLKSVYYKDGRGARDKYDGLAKRWKNALAQA